MTRATTKPQSDLLSEAVTATLRSLAAKLDWGSHSASSPSLDSFLKQVIDGFEPHHADDLATETVIELAHDLWSLADTFTPPDHVVRLRRRPSVNGRVLGFDLLEIVGHDMSFTVGSVLNTLSVHGIKARRVFHPIVTVERDANGRRTNTDAPAARESYIQIHIDRITETEEAPTLEAVKATLADVQIVNADFEAMRDVMLENADNIAADNRFPATVTEEASAFLRWLADEHFAFLGARTLDFKRDAKDKLLAEEPVDVPGTNLGVLRDTKRYVLHRGNEPTVLTPEIQGFLREPTPLIVAKSNMRSRVHREVYADYVGVKRYDDQGEVIGETRFVGLFTADAYNRMTRDVPLIRQKTDSALQKAGKHPGSHDARVLQNILETYPRDELFQIDEDTLLEIATGILKLEENPRTRMFIREDRFGRYVSALVYVPRDVFNSDLRARIGERIRAAYDGRLSAFYPSFGDAPLARIHYIIGLDPDHPDPDLDALEEAIVIEALTWSDRFRDAVKESGLSDAAESGALLFANGFNAAYREAFSIHEAILDITEIASLSADMPVSLRAYRTDKDGADGFAVKIYAREHAIPLSDFVPVFENMGLFVERETSFPVYPSAVPSEGATDSYWVHHLVVRSETRQPIDIDVVRSTFDEAFRAIWSGETENDGFNRLILAAGATWQEAALIRTLARYRAQSGRDPALPIQINAFMAQSEITRNILKLFKLRFDPALAQGNAERDKQCKALMADLRDQLNAVESLEVDGILRRTAALIMATQRTNFYQRKRSPHARQVISLKIASRELADLPSPKPFREIFVCAPHVEGVHLRFGPVARGGLRWSDRHDDFRTEVLGLVKAQQVKNAVIVPVGSKGGFVPKMLPVNGTREEIRDEGVRAYKTFISSLLDITDNLVDGVVVPPADVVIWDGNDPYLVVAADKGTATFSDIANGLSEDRGFWLSDAFASGGSVGYDHKKMGITARGGWVAVQRHFREIGKDIQNEPFTVIGVGDMSGDVFGNGMLLSKQIKLVAAFNHLDIFIDPDPQDLEASWTERKRLFDLPRSTWQDYDAKLISKGGGVFSRSTKSIEVTDEVKALTGLTADTVTPNELITALLKAEAELLWFGGIGTYIKAKSESDADAGDRANDPVRVNAKDVRASVIGEGANLGITQLGRIEFARRGGRINTDAVDNSAGVDSSDHEVNIKILLSAAIENGKLKASERNELLASMTDDVAEHVLQNNYNQTAALTVAESRSAGDRDAHERFIERLQSAGRLDRSVEFLPTSEEFRELADRNEGLTRPEISIILAYAKNTLFDDLIETDVPDDPHFDTTLQNYFPEKLSTFDGALKTHRLRREIITTYLVNRIVNQGGPTFVHRVAESANVDTPAIARAFEAARMIFRFEDLLNQINGLDNQVPADLQTDLKFELIVLLRRQAFWLARNGGGDAPIGDTIEKFQPGVDELKPIIGNLASEFEVSRAKSRQSGFEARGAPALLAEEVAYLRTLTSSTDIINLSIETGMSATAAARLYHGFGERLRFDHLRAAANSAASTEHWDRLATRRLVEDLMGQQASVTRHLLQHLPSLDINQENLTKADALAIIDDWLSECDVAYRQLTGSISELERTGHWTFAKLVLVTDSVRGFLSQSGL